MTTPEGKVKAAVKKVLDRHKARYEYWPVPSGYGPSSLDCIVCFRGRFIGIETKAPGNKPTKRQAMTIGHMERAGARVFVIDGPEGVAQLEEYLSTIAVVN